MAVFAFYTFQLKRLPHQTELDFPDLPPVPRNDEQDELFRNLFISDKSMELFNGIRRKDGSYDNRTLVKYNCDILINKGGIIVMTVEANKKKTTIVEKQKISHQHNPFCHVIIDYREGYNLIAIQKHSAFDGDPAKLAMIILNAFNRMFGDYELEIDMDPLVHKFRDFWDAINEIRTRHNDKVRRICLDFTNAVEEEYSSNSAVAIISAIVRKLKAKGEMVLESNDDLEVDLEKVHDDMVALSEICMRYPQYALDVHFFSYGVYRFGKDVTAQFGVEERIIYNYVADERETDLFGESDTLDRWLDKMKGLFSKDNYVTSPYIEQAPKQRRRR